MTIINSVNLYKINPIESKSIEKDKFYLDHNGEKILISNKNKSIKKDDCLQENIKKVVYFD